MIELIGFVTGLLTVFFFVAMVWGSILFIAIFIYTVPYRFWASWKRKEEKKRISAIVKDATTLYKSWILRRKPTY